MTPRDKELTDRTRKAVQDLVNCVNIMGSDMVVADAIAAELAHTHRTLQSSFLGAFNNAMVPFAQMPTDARNEAAVDFAKKIVAMEHYFPFI